MRVQSCHFKSRVSQRALDRFPRGSRLDRETEFRVELTGRDVIVGVRLHSRRDAQHDLRTLAFLDHLSEELEVVVSVDHDGRAGAESGPQIFEALVVAEKMNAVAR